MIVGGSRCYAVIVPLSTISSIANPKASLNVPGSLDPMRVDSIGYTTLYLIDALLQRRRRRRRRRRRKTTTRYRTPSTISPGSHADTRRRVSSRH
jgi:hypothetical protein